MIKIFFDLVIDLLVEGVPPDILQQILLFLFSFLSQAHTVLAQMREVGSLIK